MVSEKRAQRVAGEHPARPPRRRADLTRLRRAGRLAAGPLTAGGLLAVGLLARVVRAERAAARPLVFTPRIGDRPAIAVFGAQTLPSGPSGELTSRLAHALELFQAGFGEAIVVSGGQSGDLDEVEDMAAWLADHGVRHQSILTGRPGWNTRQTVGTLARLTAEQGFRPWIAVSTPYHARRIRDEARRAGVEVVVSGPRDSPETRDHGLRRTRVLTEAIATAFYLLPPSVTARVRTSPGTWRHSIPLRLAGRRS